MEHRSFLDAPETPAVVRLHKEPAPSRKIRQDYQRSPFRGCEGSASYLRAEVRSTSGITSNRYWSCTRTRTVQRTVVVVVRVPSFVRAEILHSFRTVHVRVLYCSPNALYESTKILSYFRKYFRTFVLSYESTFVLSYFSTKVLPYTYRVMWLTRYDITYHMISSHKQLYEDRVHATRSVR